MTLQNILERLAAGEVIIGDGSYTNTLEKRGYVKVGCYTPESSVEHPEAVENLAEEYARAGADITQTFTFYSRDVGTPEGCQLTVIVRRREDRPPDSFPSAWRSTRPAATSLGGSPTGGEPSWRAASSRPAPTRRARAGRRSSRSSERAWRF